MAIKTLLLEYQEWDGVQNTTILYCDPKEEALYAEFTDYMDNTFDTIELAVNLEQIIKIRDFLNGKIENIKKRQEGK